MEFLKNRKGSAILLAHSAAYLQLVVIPSLRQLVDGVGGEEIRVGWYGGGLLAQWLGIQFFIQRRSSSRNLR